MSERWEREGGGCKAWTDLDELVRVVGDDDFGPKQLVQALEPLQKNGTGMPSR
jgi:hypothetical protein